MGEIYKNLKRWGKEYMLKRILKKLKGCASEDG